MTHCTRTELRTESHLRTGRVLTSSCLNCFCVGLSLQQDTRYLRNTMHKMDANTKENKLYELRLKVENVKSHKSRIQSLEREITDLNITKRMGVAPFTTHGHKAKDSSRESARDARDAQGTDGRRSSARAPSAPATGDPDRPRSSGRVSSGH